jgi:hypothetical protein
MTPKKFVKTLKAEVRDEAKSEVSYFLKPESESPPRHLARFSKWYKGLSASERKIARDLIQYAAEGSLFQLLTFLDNVGYLGSDTGTFELWHISGSGKRTRLNDPDGELLNELFNLV